MDIRCLLGPLLLSRLGYFVDLHAIGRWLCLKSGGNNIDSDIVDIYRVACANFAREVIHAS
jgi:hypothetical protein